MKIVIISKLWEKTSPNSVGGTGVFIGNLAENLVKNGHQIFLFATGNSTKKVTKLFPIIKEPFKNYSEPIHYLNIAHGFEYAHKIKADIIHASVDHTSLYFSRLSRIPVLHTIDYGDLFQDDINILKKYRTENFVTISRAMKQKFYYLNWKGVIHPGINIKKFPFIQGNKGKYLLFIGRLSPQKGPDIAIKIAKKTKIPLILAGKLSEIDKNYLDKKVLPYIDGKLIKYVGVANFKKKVNLFKNAKAFLHPINYFEAFGITLIEAGACGVPVVTFNKGAVKEIIKDGKTGFIVNDFKKAIQALKNINKIDRMECKKHIENNFSVERMADEYEEVYKKLIK